MTALPAGCLAVKSGRHRVSSHVRRRAGWPAPASSHQRLSYSHGNNPGSTRKSGSLARFHGSTSVPRSQTDNQDIYMRTAAQRLRISVRGTTLRTDMAIETKVTNPPSMYDRQSTVPHETHQGWELSISSFRRGLDSLATTGSIGRSLHTQASSACCRSDSVVCLRFPPASRLPNLVLPLDPGRVSAWSVGELVGLYFTVPYFGQNALV